VNQSKTTRTNDGARPKKHGRYKGTRGSANDRDEIIAVMREEGRPAANREMIIPGR